MQAADAVADPCVRRYGLKTHRLGALRDARDPVRLAHRGTRRATARWEAWRLIEWPTGEPEPHAPHSIATRRWRIALLLAAMLTQCPCCLRSAGSMTTSRCHRSADGLSRNSRPRSWDDGHGTNLRGRRRPRPIRPGRARNRNFAEIDLAQPRLALVAIKFKSTVRFITDRRWGACRTQSLLLCSSQSASWCSAPDRWDAT